MNNFEKNQSAVNFKKTSAYTVKLKELEFEGPLDLLLFLVKKAEIDINDISILSLHLHLPFSPFSLFTLHSCGHILHFSSSSNIFTSTYCMYFYKNSLILLR